MSQPFKSNINREMATSQDVPHHEKRNSSEKTSDLQESKRSTGPDDEVNQRRLWLVN